MAGGNESLNAIQSLDLRGVTLIPGGECYAQKGVFSSGGVVSINISFYLSDDNTLTYTTSDWLGTYITSGVARNNCFAGVFGSFAGLTTIYLPEYMTEIGPAAFRGNTSVQKVVMGSKVERIGEYAFAYSGIRTLDAPQSLTRIDNRAFLYSELESISSLKNVDTIGLGAFEYSKIKNVDLPGIKSIGGYAFNGSPLQSAVLGGPIKVISEHAFNCPSMTSFAYPASIDSIGSFGLTSPWLKSKTAENGIIYVNNVACALTQDFPASISVKEGTTHIVDDFFAGSEVTMAGSQQSINLTIPKSMRYIGEAAFANCPLLAKVTFTPGGDLYIKDRAFSTGNPLEVHEFPQGISFIGLQAFPTVRNVVWRLPCVRLAENAEPFLTVESVTIGAEADSIPARLFKDLSNIADITFEPRPANRPLSIGDDAFRRPYIESSLTRQIHNFPANVTYVGSNNFASDYAPIHFDSPVDLTHVRYVGDRAFLRASDAFAGDTLVFPAGLKYIGTMAFGGLDVKHVAVNCDSLESALNIFIEPSKENWSEYYPSFNTNIKSVSVSKNVRSLPHRIFGGCIELEKVEFEERPRQNPVPLSIGSCIVGGFIGELYRVEDTPSKVTEWNLPYGTVSISGVAFDQAARSITLPATFKNFTLSLSTNRYPYSHDMTIFCHAPEVPTFSNRLSYAFELSNSLPSTVTVYVPARSLALYQSDTVWGTAKILAFADDLLEINGVQYAEVGIDDEGYVLLEVSGIADATTDPVVDTAFERGGDKFRTTGINQSVFAGKTLNSFTLTHSRDWEPGTFTFKPKSFARTTLNDFITDVNSHLIFETESFDRFNLRAEKFRITSNATLKTGAIHPDHRIDFVFDNAVNLGHLTMHAGALSYFRNMEFYGKTLECIADPECEYPLAFTGTLVLGNTVAELIGADNINYRGVDIKSYAVVPPALSGFSAESRSNSRYYYPRCVEDRYAKSWQGFLESSSINGYCIDGPEGSFFGYADEIADIHDFVLGTTDKTYAAVPTQISLFG